MRRRAISRSSKPRVSATIMAYTMDNRGNIPASTGDIILQHLIDYLEEAQIQDYLL